MKWLLIGFIILQLGIDLAHSVTVFPFVHYGMFSERLAQPDSLAVFEVRVDGRLLQASDFRVYRWDMIQTPLAAIENEADTHDFASDKERMGSAFSRIGAAGVYRSLSPQLNNDSAVIARFPLWYKNYLSGLLGYAIHHLQVDKIWYQYINGQLRAVRKENRINS